MPPVELLTPNQVAVLLRVSPVTVRHWALDGKLKFVTTPGGHRRFTFADIQNFAQEHGVSLNQDLPHGLRVLVVDDNIELANFLKELLETQAQVATVDVAHDGFAAGEMLHSFKPDVVLLDLMMPELDGFDTCWRIKHKDSMQHIRIIAMTGFPSEENIQRILATGAEACLAKPVRAAMLFEALGLDGKQTTQTLASL